MEPINIFLDMDDVVADWMSYARDKFGVNYDFARGERCPQAEWDRLKSDDRFYLNLPLKPNAHDLVEYCKALTSRTGGSLQFLSALPHDYSMPYASQDKVWWAHQHFPGIPVFLGPFSHDKWRYAKGINYILIDDRISNCNEWESAGGRAHIYTEWSQCQQWLDQNFA